MPVGITVIMTVKNDARGCARTLESLASQTRRPDETVVVDGGSTDGTVGVIEQAAVRDQTLRWIEAPGTNIAQGRNLAAQSAKSEVIACIDSGCVARPDWLAKLAEPFEAQPQVEFVAGFYRVQAETLLERVVGLATMRGQLDPVDAETFNPSARSMACRKSVWSRAGGWPEWLGFSEDTLFDHKVRRMKVVWRFAADAIVEWRPRATIRAVAKQFYHYGTGRGHTQIDAPGFRYNIRNLSLMVALIGLSLVTTWAAPALLAAFGYFYVWAFHHKAAEIARRTERAWAYPLCIGVMWVVLASNLTGYLVGSWQRWRNPDGYRGRMAAYLAC